MFRLTKLIFIDSYSPKKKALVNLQGNTNLNGDNGLGKTTMLRVLPLFFGAAPGQLVRRSGTNKSFVDYYLPRPTSYIIFEYERESEKNLVVIFRGDNALRFCFMKQSYDDQFFFDDTSVQSNVIASSDWIRTMKLNGYEPSQRFGVEDYKSIIQSGLNYTEATNRKRRAIINHHRMLYSFCRRGTSIQNIDLITTAILEREPSIVSIKEILSNILTHNSSTGFEKIPTLTIKSSKLTEWINDRDSYQAMSQCEPDIVGLATLKYQYDDCINTQKALRTQVKVMTSKLTKELDAAIPLRDTSKLELDAHRDKSSKYSRAHTDSKNSLESKLEVVGKRIDSLVSEKASFTADNVEEKQKRVKEIPTIEAKIEQLDQQYQILISEQQNIENKFEKLINTLKENHQSKLLAFSEEEKSQLNDYQDSILSLNEERQSQLQTQESKYTEEQEKRQSRVNVVGIEKARYEASLENTLPPPELTNAHQASEEMLNSLNLKTSDLDNDITQAMLAQQNHKESINALSAEVEELGREKRNLDNELEKLRRLKNPEKNNLLSFVRENHDSWTSNIAKVVPEELLLRTDLSPEITTSHNSIYGMKIDLSVIETARAADESLLQQQMLQLDNELARKEEQINNIEDEAKQLQGQSKKFEIAILEAKNIRQKHGNSISETREQLQIYKSQIKAAIAEIKSTQEKEISECNERLRVETLRVKEHRQSYEATKETIKQKFKQSKERLDQVLTKQKASVAKNIENAKTNHDKELAQLNEQKVSALVKQGVNPEFLESLNTGLEEEHQKLKIAKESKPLVEKHDAWLRNEWNQHQDLQAQYRETNEALAQCVGDWKQKKEDLERREKELETFWVQENKNCERLGNEIKHANQLLENFPDNGELNESDAQLADNLINISLLESRWDSTLKQYRQYEKEGRKIYDTVRKKISAFRDSSPHKYLERITADFVQVSGHFQNEWLFAATSLSDYMRKSHQEHLSLLQDDARLLGQQISDHHTALSRTHKEINQLGRVSVHA